ncbi:hypothetical protein [Ideonella livida]|uniref:Uncharacterized protein n=1 Tax=Ideonella livida TaxID=2707176 RepID=A0A7C9TJL3_9BURK|nr:hypothetical protein [Ideonella livida]NDY89726.1 hypothetical protein [Ideonella livida]
MSKLHAMQATFVTFGREPVTMVGAVDMESGALRVVGPATGILLDRSRPDVAFVTDRWDCADFDWLYAQETVGPSVLALRTMESMGRLAIDSKAQRWNPGNAVQFDGLDTDGKPKIRMDSTANNGHMAILALCWMAEQLMTFAHVLRAGDDLTAASAQAVAATFRARGASSPLAGRPSAGTGEFSGMHFAHGQPRF